jgi:hypothetical protein
VTVASGRFEQANVTAVVNVPPFGVAVKAYERVVCPASTVCVPPPVQVKSGGAVTVSWKVVVRVAAGFVVVPWIVTVVVPVGVLAAAVTVSVTLAGLPMWASPGSRSKLHAIAFAGSPLELLSA